MSLPILQTSDKNFQLMQTGWAQQLNPVLSNLLVNSIVLKQISLSTGDNVINTKLGRLQQGWLISDINSAVQIFRNAPFNDLTLTLNSSGSAIVDLVIF